MKAQLESLVLQMHRGGMRFEEALREFQGVFILTVLREQKGNQCRAAEKLGMHRNTLRRTIRGKAICQFSQRGWITALKVGNLSTELIVRVTGGRRYRCEFSQEQFL